MSEYDVTSVKYSNTDTSTNINQTPAVNLPVFGTLEWNDNTTLYTVDTVNHTVTVTETGRYKIIVNASFQVTSASSRTAPELYVTINGSQVGTTASTGYMRRANGQNEASVNFTEVLELSANDIIAVETVRAANAGTVVLRNTGTTNIFIEKIL